MTIEEWENMSDQEKKERDKKIRKNKIKRIFDFIIGLLAFLIMAAGTDAIGKEIFTSKYFGGIGMIIFFGILFWNQKTAKNAAKEKDDKIENDKMRAFKKLDEIDKRIVEMYENDEISFEVASELKESIQEAKKKNSDINHKFVSLLFNNR